MGYVTPFKFLETSWKNGKKERKSGGAGSSGKVKMITDFLTSQGHCILQVRAAKLAYRRCIRSTSDSRVGTISSGPNPS